MKKCVTIMMALLLACAAVSASAQTAVVRTEKGKLNLRSRPDADAVVLAYVPNGSVVTLVEAAEDGWYRVAYRGKTGYVISDYLALEDGAVYTDHAAFAFVRERPDDDAALKAVLTYVDPITVLSTDGDWSYVSCQNSDGETVIGYLRTEAIAQGRTEPADAADVVESDTEARLTDDQRLYEWPDSAAESPVTLPQDAVVVILRAEGDWSYVVADAYSGYVRSSALEPTGNRGAAQRDGDTDDQASQDPATVTGATHPSADDSASAKASDASPVGKTDSPAETPPVGKADSPAETPSVGKTDKPQSTPAAEEPKDTINEAKARGIADAALRRKYPAFAGATFSSVSCRYVTEDAAFATPYYQFDYYENGSPIYSAMVNAQTREVLYLFGSLSGEGNG